jgi:hypothetical protein
VLIPAARKAPKRSVAHGREIFVSNPSKFLRFAASSRNDTNGRWWRLNRYASEGNGLPENDRRFGLFDCLRATPGKFRMHTTGQRNRSPRHFQMLAENLPGSSRDLRGAHTSDLRGAPFEERATDSRCDRSAVPIDKLTRRGF